MSQKVTSVLILVLSFLVLFLLASTFFKSITGESKISYVNNAVLFNQFNMSKDMERKHKSVIERTKKSFDSIYNMYNILKEQKNIEKLKELELQLREKDIQIKQMEEYLSKDVSQQIWSRLNQYVKEYGKENDCQLILGKQGAGNIMYASEELDVTQDLVEYVNLKYEGN